MQGKLFQKRESIPFVALVPKSPLTHYTGFVPISGTPATKELSRAPCPFIGASDCEECLIALIWMNRPQKVVWLKARQGGLPAFRDIQKSTSESADLTGSRRRDARPRLPPPSGLLDLREPKWGRRRMAHLRGGRPPRSKYPLRVGKRVATGHPEASIP